MPWHRPPLHSCSSSLNPVPHPSDFSSGCSERLLVAKTPRPLLSLSANHSPVPLTREICLLGGPQLPEFPWQQPPWGSLLPAETLISESACCCFSLEDLQTEEEGQKELGKEKKFTPGRRERRKKTEVQRHTLAVICREPLELS